MGTMETNTMLLQPSPESINILPATQNSLRVACPKHSHFPPAFTVNASLHFIVFSSMWQTPDNFFSLVLPNFCLNKPHNYQVTFNLQCPPSSSLSPFNVSVKSTGSLTCLLSLSLSCVGCIHTVQFTKFLCPLYLLQISSWVQSCYQSQIWDLWQDYW